MKTWFVGHRLQAKDHVIDLFYATPSRANFLMAVASSKRVLRLIRAENKRTQLCLQIESAEEKSQSLHSQKSPLGTQQNVRHKRKKIVTLNVTQNFCVQARNRPETF